MATSMRKLAHTALILLICFCVCDGVTGSATSPTSTNTTSTTVASTTVASTTVASTTVSLTTVAPTIAPTTSTTTTTTPDVCANFEHHIRTGSGDVGTCAGFFAQNVLGNISCAINYWQQHHPECPFSPSHNPAYPDGSCEEFLAASYESRHMSFTEVIHRWQVACPPVVPAVPAFSTRSTTTTPQALSQCTDTTSPAIVASIISQGYNVEDTGIINGLKNDRDHFDDPRHCPLFLRSLFTGKVACLINLWQSVHNAVAKAFRECRPVGPSPSYYEPPVNITCDDFLEKVYYSPTSINTIVYDWAVVCPPTSTAITPGG